MSDFWVGVWGRVLSGLAVLAIGAMLRPFLNRLLSPKEKRQAEVERKADKALQSFIQNVRGDVLRQEIHYHFQNVTTAMNTAYVTTGHGEPVIPEPRKIYPAGIESSVTFGTPSISSEAARPPGGWPWEKDKET